MYALLRSMVVIKHILGCTLQISSIDIHFDCLTSQSSFPCTNKLWSIVGDV